MLARLTKTLSTNAAIAGTVAIVLGASGSAVAFTAGNDQPSTPGGTQAEQGDDDQGTDADTDTDKPESDASDPNQSDAQDTGVRPTDTHGYCVSQLAQSASTDRTGTGADAVTHGSLVSAAAQACGKTTAADKAARTAAKPAKTHGKGFGRHHGTGRPAAVSAAH